MAREAKVDRGLELDDPRAKIVGQLVREHEVVEEVELTAGLAVRTGRTRRDDRLRTARDRREHPTRRARHAFVAPRSPRWQRPATPTTRGSSRARAERASPRPRRGSRARPSFGARSYPRSIGRLLRRGSLSPVSAVDAQDAALELVHGSGRAPARARAHLPPLVAVRRARRATCPSPGSFARRRSATFPSSSCATRRTRCARSSTSAAIAARSSARARAGARRSSVRTTRGRTARRPPHHRAAREQGRRDRQGRSSGSCLSASRRGGHCSSSTRTRTRSRSTTASTASPSGSRTRGSTSTRCASSSAPSPSSTATGRSPPRTSSSATTARPRTPGSPPSWT